LRVGEGEGLTDDCVRIQPGDGVRILLRNLSAA
jgi:hypothetical protein